MIDEVLRGCAAASEELIARYERVSVDQLYAPVIDLLPQQPSLIADIGAGTGRDAAWLANNGHHVVAVEPVEEFRRAGAALHDSPRIEWIDDRLPDLWSLRSSKRCFDCIFLSAVWQHLDDDRRSAALHSLATLTARNGTVVMSLRHGAGAASRQIYEARPEDTIEAATRTGFELVRRRDAESMQAINRHSGVRWTWLALRLP
jgi:SAM-dependent methyltransferase